MLLKTFFPREREKSAYGIDYQNLYEQGYRGIIFDIDNTLVPHGAPADECAIALFERLRAIGFSTCLISNNKEPRVKPFADAVRSSYIYNAHKPLTKNYLKAVNRMGITVPAALFVGDQIFTDVWGANRAGIRTILTDPIDPKEEIQIVLKRYPERIILRAYARYLRKRHNKTAKER